MAALNRRQFNSAEAQKEAAPKPVTREEFDALKAVLMTVMTRLHHSNDLALVGLMAEIKVLASI